MTLRQNELLPVSTVLSFFNISLNQYFNLTQVPFPVVTPRGRVVYQDGTPYKSISRTYNNRTYPTQAIAQQALQEVKEAYLAELKLMRVEIDQAISKL